MEKNPVAIAQLPPFARLLRHYRIDAALTQEELAERAGLSARAISDLERGVKTRPHRVTVELLADALGLQAEERERLAAAVPPSGAAHARRGDTTPYLASDGDHPPALSVQRVRSSRELHQILEGLVGLYVEEERSGSQLSVAVIVFSTEKM
jgi:transcriptional regulator with XRE-family HTH domain